MPVLNWLVIIQPVVWYARYKSVKYSRCRVQRCVWYDTVWSTGGKTEGGESQGSGHPWEPGLPGCCCQCTLRNQSRRIEQKSNKSRWKLEPTTLLRGKIWFGCNASCGNQGRPVANAPLEAKACQRKHDWVHFATLLGETRTYPRKQKPECKTSQYVCHKQLLLHCPIRNFPFWNQGWWFLHKTRKIVQLWSGIKICCQGYFRTVCGSLFAPGRV